MKEEQEDKRIKMIDIVIAKDIEKGTIIRLIYNDKPIDHFYCDQDPCSSVERLTLLPIYR